ncbi:hypothetical protein HELRODRAFT_191237 [Helobdella robusta]|uniref:UV radiation resistance-associated gene protein n=1 Tax=Helobdella robusta TaxID=6412 RepID=T1FSS0_HELRO|nr:hypothetical protein HELRODRAFT_191237 [Helobdella robusta]ESO06903.1 hypothetical protein HELRODRAFT_191237 [Helobdella robusta]
MHSQPNSDNYYFLKQRRVRHLKGIMLKNLRLKKEINSYVELCSFSLFFTLHKDSNSTECKNKINQIATTISNNNNSNNNNNNKDGGDEQNEPCTNNTNTDDEHSEPYANVSYNDISYQTFHRYHYINNICHSNNNDGDNNNKCDDINICNNNNNNNSHNNISDSIVLVTTLEANFKNLVPISLHHTHVYNANAIVLDFDDGLFCLAPTDHDHPKHHSSNDQLQQQQHTSTNIHPHHHPHHHHHHKDDDDDGDGKDGDGGKSGCKVGVAVSINQQRLSYRLDSLKRLQITLNAVEELKDKVEKLKTSVTSILTERQSKYNKRYELNAMKIKVQRLRRELEQRRSARLLEETKLESIRSSNEIDDLVMTENTQQLAVSWDELHEKKKGEQLIKVGTQLVHRRKYLLTDLSTIYPITKGKPDNVITSSSPAAKRIASEPYYICNVHLPQSENMLGQDDVMISVALGYTAHLVSMVSFFLDVPLRYPIRNAGSSSSVRDDIIDLLNAKEREFPLAIKGRDRFQFDYAVFLLNKNIIQLRHYCGVATSQLGMTLANLYTLLNDKLGVVYNGNQSNAFISQHLHVPPSFGGPAHKTFVTRIASTTTTTTSTVMTTSTPIAATMRMTSSTEASADAITVGALAFPLSSMFLDSSLSESSTSLDRTPQSSIIIPSHEGITSSALTLTSTDTTTESTPLILTTAAAATTTTTAATAAAALETISISTSRSTESLIIPEMVEPVITYESMLPELDKILKIPQPIFGSHEFPRFINKVPLSRSTIRHQDDKEEDDDGVNDNVDDEVNDIYGSSVLDDCNRNNDNDDGNNNNDDNNNNDNSDNIIINNNNDIFNYEEDHRNILKNMILNFSETPDNCSLADDVDN